MQAFLAAGHVCSVMGTAEYPPLAEKYRVPIVVTGFEPLDILEGIRRTVLQLEAGRHEVENAYPRAVRAEGNLPAMEMLRDVFEVTDRTWRGIGMIPRQRLAALGAVRASSTPSTASRSPASTPRSRRCAAPARCSRG